MAWWHLAEVVVAVRARGGRRRSAPDDRRAPVTVRRADLEACWERVPVHEAAARFGLSPTAFKNACRRLGVARWPFRDAVRARARLQEAAEESVWDALPGEPFPCALGGSVDEVLARLWPLPPG